MRLPPFLIRSPVPMRFTPTLYPPLLCFRLFRRRRRSPLSRLLFIIYLNSSLANADTPSPSPISSTMQPSLLMLFSLHLSTSCRLKNMASAVGPASGPYDGPCAPFPFLLVVGRRFDSKTLYDLTDDAFPSLPFLAIIAALLVVELDWLLDCWIHGFRSLPLSLFIHSFDRLFHWPSQSCCIFSILPPPTVPSTALL